MTQRLGRIFGRQFARPHGLLGQLAARVMRRSNAPLNHWVIDLLAVEPGSRVLEVGFGPGVALAELLDRASRGTVTGVDVSESMANQARARYRNAIEAGRLRICEGDASSLPFRDATFDKVCGTHVVYFWRDPLTTVQELARVLRPGGTLALGYQERAHMPPMAAQGLAAAGARLVGPGDVERVVRDAAFGSVRVESKRGPKGPEGFCVVAIK